MKSRKLLALVYKMDGGDRQQEHNITSVLRILPFKRIVLAICTDKIRMMFYPNMMDISAIKRLDINLHSQLQK